MSCPYFAKEVSYLVHSPICSPPTFLTSKHHGWSTWRRRPRWWGLPWWQEIMLPGCNWWKTSFLQGFLEYVVYLHGSAHCHGTTLLWHPPNRAYSVRGVPPYGPKGKGQCCVANTWNTDCLQRQRSDMRQLIDCCLSSAKVTLTACFFSTCASVANLTAIFLRTWYYLLHFVPKVESYPKGFEMCALCKQVAMVSWNAPYMSSRWNARWAEGREGTILSFFP